MALLDDVTARVYKAFDVEKVTKRFYERFRKELTAFGEFIEGITAEGDRDWYASLMLNRMMFVYFVQKQGFLDGRLPTTFATKSARRSRGRYGRRPLSAVLSRVPTKGSSTKGLGQPVDPACNQELEGPAGQGAIPQWRTLRSS